MEIPVTYQCWGCGSEKIKYEETEVPIPSKTIWNLCPDCVKRQEERRTHEPTPERTQATG